MARFPLSRRRRLAAALALAVVAGLAVGPWLTLRVAVRDQLRPPTGPATPGQLPTALVLGAALNPDGSPSDLLAARIAAAARLYAEGRVAALVLSGNSPGDGNVQVSAMVARAVALGVPAAATLRDDAGYDTYSSCWRARRVFGLHRVLVVTQPFHLPRAVWLCGSLGLAAAGAPAAEGSSLAVWYGRARELPAAAKAVLDVARGRRPASPGPLRAP